MKNTTSIYSPLDQNPNPKPNSNKLIIAAAVRKMFGGVSDMTIWRWVQDEKLDFPKPLYIGRTRYWREAELVAWVEAQQHSKV